MGAPPIEGPRWRIPAIVAASLVGLVVILVVISLVDGGGGGPRTVTTFVPDTTGSITAPPSAFPLGAVLPATVDGWFVSATDPASAEHELRQLGRVETAHARRGGATGVLIGLRPDHEDARITVERVRGVIGGFPEGAVQLTGVPSSAQVQRDGAFVAVTFADAGRVIVAIATDRDVAVALAAATGRAIP